MAVKGNARDWQVRFRLWAAIVMITYVLGYYIYYLLGLISVELMEDYQNAVSFLWPLFWVIPVVLLIHVSLGMWKLYRRNTLKMPAWERAQILLGICIPMLLLPHIIITYGAYLFYGMKQTYIDQLMITYPPLTWQYIAMTLVIWAHGQIGVHVVLRMRKWYPKVRYIIITVFSIMPLIGIAGYLKAGMDLTNLIKAGKETLSLPAPEEIKVLRNAAFIVYGVFLVIYAFVLIARAFRIRKRNREKNLKVLYRSGQSVAVFSGTTILEASRIGNIPHASICGGRGRCTTCRVKIEDGMDNLSLVGEREMKALKRIEAEHDVRLACQAECRKGDVAVTLLLPPDIASSKARKENKLSVGKETELAVMFVDLRGFTRFSEKKFPYDVVFVLNNYFNSMGEIIERNNGKIDKFIGDGILAYFGFDSSPQEACRDALLTARQMAEKLQEINEQLKHAIVEPLEIGIGLHFGEVILGEMGYKDKSTLTIIGDTVNTSSRLESLNKQTASQLIFTKTVADHAEGDFTRLKKYNATVRGKNEPLEIYVVKKIIEELKLK